MGDIPKDRVEALQALLQQAVRFYRSRYGEELASADWLAFHQALEAFDDATGGVLLGRGRESELPILFEPAKAIQALVDPKAGDHQNRAFHVLDKYEFVFQLVRAQGLPGVGPKIGRVLDGLLSRFGLSRGMDLGPYERELNAVTQPDYFVIAEHWNLTEDGADFYFDEKTSEEGRLSGIAIKFETPSAVVARFERQYWRSSVLEIGVTSTLRCEVHDDITAALRKAFSKKPETLMRRPVRWLLRHATAFDGKPKGRGWKQVPNQSYWQRNEVLWLAPGAEAPKSETM